MTNNEIKYAFENIFIESDYLDTSRLHCSEFTFGEADTMFVKLYGGLNGWGNSKDYFYDLYQLIEKLEKHNILAYAVNFEIDALDDLFYVTLELRDLEEFNKEKPE